MKEFPAWHTRVLVSLSQIFNVVFFNGYPDEMLSSRVYRLHWHYFIKFFDYIFFWQESHCERCYYWEKERADSPRYTDVIPHGDDEPFINPGN